MRVLRRIYAPFPVKENQAAIDAFAEFCRRHGLKIVPNVDLDVPIEEGDSRIQQLLDVLAHHDFSLRPDHVSFYLSDEDRRRYVNHRKQRVYETTDWDKAHYLRMLPQLRTTYEELSRDDQAGELHLYGRGPDWMRHADLGRSDRPGLDCIVSDRVRRALESAGLLRLRFGPVHYVPFDVKRQRVIAENERDAPAWWELDSDLTLPPVSDTMPLADGQGNPVPRGDPGGAHTRHPQSDDGVWRYRRSELEAVGPFDIARTVEPWGPPQFPHSPRNNLIVSQRFYRVCRDNGLDCYWVPVEVEPG